MAYEGELVKMQDGRWARFQRCTVSDGQGYTLTMLVAVELDAQYQRMLNDAHGELVSEPHAQVRMSLHADETGKWSLQVAEAAAQ